MDTVEDIIKRRKADLATELGKGQLSRRIWANHQRPKKLMEKAQAHSGTDHAKAVAGRHCLGAAHHQRTALPPLPRCLLVNSPWRLHVDMHGN
jgi:hypothetical protein